MVRSYHTWDYLVLIFLQVATTFTVDNDTVVDGIGFGDMLTDHPVRVFQVIKKVVINLFVTEMNCRCSTTRCNRHITLDG